MKSFYAKTHVKVSLLTERNTLSFFCSNVSPANRGSSLTVTLYRKIEYDNTASASVSANLSWQNACEWLIDFLRKEHTFCQDTHDVLYTRNKKRTYFRGHRIFTTAKRKERVPRPITKEPGWIEFVRIFPVSCWERGHVSNQMSRARTDGKKIHWRL